MPTHHTMLLRFAFIATALALLSIAVFDGPLALMLASVPEEVRHGINQGVRMCEWLFGFPVSPYLYGALMVAAGIAVRKRSPTLARSLLFIGLAHLTGRLVAGVMKPPFSRLRPFEALADNTWQDTWFAQVGNSFPSGHAAHFWSLFFPLVVLFPRYWLPLAVLPVLISAARIVVNHHYLSDVAASVAVAASITWAYSRIMISSPPQPGAVRDAANRRASGSAGS
ncbi:MAG: phosphatase PAP2 family protein [Rhodospirillales bacterium]